MRKSISGQLISVFIAHTLAEVMADEPVDAETICSAIRKFRTDLVDLIESSQPTWFSETIDHAKVFWEAKPSSAKYLIGLLQGSNRLQERTVGWLASKGFPKSNISIGVDTGRIILTDREALGTTISASYQLAAFGMDQGEVAVVSQETISILESAWNIESRFVELKMSTTKNTPSRHVAILPLRMF